MFCGSKATGKKCFAVYIFFAVALLPQKNLICSSKASGKYFFAVVKTNGKKCFRVVKLTEKMFAYSKYTQD